VLTDARRMVFFAACLATFMASVEATIVATAIPTIVSDLGGLRLFTWVFGIYFLTQAVTIPIYGRLADFYGRKPVMIVAIVIFLAGSILSGFAHDMLALIVFRGIQGIGGGGVQPMATTIVGDLYTGKQRARVQGFLSSTWGISAVIGPLLGAFLIARLGWPTIFWVNVPFGILCIGVLLRYFNETVERRTHTIDYLGSILLALSIGMLMYVLVSFGTLPGGVLATLGVAALVLSVLLIAHELRTPEPMLALALMRTRIIGIANSGNFMIGALTMGITAFLPTYVQGAMGGSAIVAGASLGVMSAAWVAGAIAGARLLMHTTYRTIALIGGACLVAGSCFLIALTPSASIWQAIAGSAIIGLGLGFVNLVFVVSTQSAVGWAQRGAATASNIFMRQLGQSIGTAAFGAVFNLGLYARIPNAGDVATRMMEPAQRAHIAPDDVVRYASAIAASLHGIYITLGVLGAIVLLLTIALPAHLRPGEGAEPA
jgi:EmrB/QacA subfamily drug resistance transporter